MKKPVLKEVSKKEFYESFETLQGIKTGCPSYMIWEVTDRNGNVIAVAIDSKESEEKYYIKAN
jgi:hypothetical protein